MKGQPTSAKVSEIRRWHISPPNNWSDIGYHHLIDRDGTLAVGRPIERVGAHVRGHNTGTIGVSLFGGHGSSEKDEFYEHFTAAQGVVLRQYINDMQKRYPTITKITGHNEYAAKACPGFNVSDWLKDSFPRPDVEPVEPAAPSFWADLIKALLALFGGKK
jgi:hypothetical protein